MEGGGTVNSDIRLAIGFWDHPKIVKLERRTGVEGVKSLLILWQWVAQCKPNGYLYGMDMDDVEIVSRWHGGVGEFCKNLVDLRLLDVLEGGIGFKVHDWEIHNPWASEAQKREDEARLASLKRWNRKVYEELVSQGLTSITKEDYLRVKNGLPMGTHRDPNGVPNAPSPSPSPSPYKEKVLTNVSTKKKNFIPPSLREVEAYVAERGNKINSQKFIDYYTSNGWMVGRNKMRDWKAAIRNWESNKSFSTGGSNGAPPKQTKREAYKAAVIEGVSFLKEMETEYSEKGSQS